MPTRNEFIALLVWRMCSDPWPIEEDIKHIANVDYFLNTLSMRHGYRDWVDAYHQLT